MRILMIGAGGVGDAAARIAVERDFFESFVVADHDRARPRRPVAAATGRRDGAGPFDGDRIAGGIRPGIRIQTIPSWNESGAPNTDQRGRWRRPADGESLTATLTKAGMLGGGAPTSSAPSASVPSASAVPAPSEVSAATGLPTLAVAVLAGLGGRSAHRSRTVEGREVDRCPT